MGWLSVLFRISILVIFELQCSDSEVSVRSTDITTTGKTFRVLCRVKGENYEGWYRVKGKQEYKVTGRNFFVDKFYTEDNGDGHTLIIRNVVVNDGGYYRCKGSRTSKLFHLYVEFYVLEFPKSQHLDRGQSEVIRCSAEGYPRPHFRWYKDWKPKELDYSSDRLSLLPNGSLLVTNVQETDTGNYTCRITQLEEDHRTREEQSNIQVLVFGPPRIDLTKSSSVVYSYKGNLRKVKIACRFWGYPVPQMVITKAGRQLKDQEVKRRTITGHVRAKKDGDFGAYLCNATNKLGIAEHTVYLKKADGPDHLTNVSILVHCGYITVTWHPPLFDGGLPILMYNVVLLRGGSVIDNAAVKSKRRRFTFNGGLISPNTLYTMRVQGENEASKGSWVTLNVTSDFCPPRGKISITNKKTILNTTSFLLTWEGPPDHGGDPSIEYTVEYRRLVGDGGDAHWISRKGIRGRQHHVTELSRGEKYTFRVIAVNKRGQSPPGEKDFVVVSYAVTPEPTAGTVLPPPEPVLLFDMNINCSSLLIQVVLTMNEYPNLDRNSFRLRDDSCGPYQKSRSRLAFRTRLDGCGTTSKHRNMSVTYYNSVTARVVNSKSRIHIVEFPFSCTFYKKRTIGEPSFQPRKRVTVVEEGFGNFSFEMDLYHSSKYKSPYDVSDYPVHVNPTSQMLYAQTKLLASDKNLVALTYQCVATPSIDPNDNTRYSFIDKGCAIDDTVKLKSVASRVQRFEMAPFKFRDRTSSIVYLHCRVLVCHKDDPESRCSKGCVTSKNRSRRESVPLRRSLVQRVTLGPVGLTQHKPPGDQRVSSRPILSYNLLLVLGILLISVLLVAAVGIVLRRVLRRMVSGGKGAHMKVAIGDETDLPEAVPL